MTTCKKSDTMAESVKVIVRCRPLSEKEKDNKCLRVVDMNTKSGLVEVKKPDAPKDPPKQFTFDTVYDWNSSQREVYDGTAFPIVESVLAGYNGTIFAYGQTGTGILHFRLQFLFSLFFFFRSPNFGIILMLLFR